MKKKVRKIMLALLVVGTLAASPGLCALVHGVSSVCVVANALRLSSANSA